MLHKGPGCVSELATSDHKPRLLRVVSKCSSEDEFVALFSRFCDGDSLFIVTRKPKPAGTRQPVCLTLADGTPMIAGTGQVLDAFDQPAGPFKRPGMRIAFPDLDARGREMLDRLGGRGSKPPPLPPVAPARGTQADAPDEDDDEDEPTNVADPLAPLAAPAVEPSAERAQHAAVVIPANPLSDLTDESLQGFVECQIYEETAVAQMMGGGESASMSQVEAADTSIPGGLPAWWPSAQSAPEPVPANPLAGLADDEIEGAPRPATGAEDSARAAGATPLSARGDAVLPLPEPPAASAAAAGSDRDEAVSAGAAESARSNGVPATTPSGATSAVAVVPPPRLPSSDAAAEGKRAGSQSGVHARPVPPVPAPAPLSGKMTRVEASPNRAPSTAPAPGLPPLRPESEDDDSARIHNVPPEPDAAADDAPWFAVDSDAAAAGPAEAANPVLLAPDGTSDSLRALLGDDTPVWKRPVVLVAVALLLGLGLGFAMFGGGTDEVAEVAADEAGEPAVVAAAATAGAAKTAVADVTPGDDVEGLAPPADDAEDGSGDIPAAGSQAGDAEAAEPETEPAAADEVDSEFEDELDAAEDEAALAAELAATGVPEAGGGDCSVEVRSRPAGAPIYVGGKSTAQRTPATVSVPCGAVEVSLRHPRYKLASREVTAGPGGAAVEVSLSRPVHKLTVLSKPAGATVKVNGRKVGTTPATVSVPGFEKARVEVAKFGFKATKKRVYVRRKKQRVNLRMKPLARGLFKRRN